MPHAPTHHLFNAANLDRYAAAVQQGVVHLTDHVRSLRGPFTGSAVEHLAKIVDDVDLDRPLGGLRDVLSELDDVYLDDAVWFHDPTYAAHLNCPVVIPALVAELYVSAVNSSLDTWDQSAGGTLVEQRLVDWTAGRIGFAPEQAGGVFTSGGTQSNLQAMLLARGEKVGVHAPNARILASADAHFSIQKAAHVLGLGHEAVLSVPVDADRRMDVGALETLLASCERAGETVVAVVATAGTTDFGRIDPLPQVAALARAHGAWLHVDAAYGGGLLASQRRRHLLDGIHHADSVTVDYHKTFFQPVSSSALVVRDAQALRHVTWHADYLNPADADAPNQVDVSMQTTRRFDALKLWLTLRQMGPDAVGDLFDDAIDLAHDVHAMLERDPDFEVAAAPQLSTVVFRYRPVGMSAATAAALAPRIRAELFARGTAVVACTKVDGEAWLKLTLLNASATVHDLALVLDQLREIGRAVTTLEEAC